MKKNLLSMLYAIVCILSSVLVFAQETERVPNYAEDYQFITKDGAWCWFSDPRAIYIDGIMFGGYVDKQGDIWAFSYDPKTQESKRTRLFEKLNYDDHANPSIMETVDGKLAIYFSAHGPSPIYCAISKKRADISEFELTEAAPLQPRFGLCYSNAMTLSSENNRTYLFFRGSNFKPNFIYSDDNLKTWSDPETLIVNDPTMGEYGRPYTKYATNFKNKMFVAFTDGHPRDEATNSIYFVMYKDGKLCKADGTVISESIHKPITQSMAEVVYDAKKTFHKAWIWDIAFDKEENPVLVYARFSDGDDSHSYWYARWNGKEWENHRITHAGSWFMRADYKKESPERENNYSGGVILDHEDPNIVYTSRPIRDTFEIEKWTFIGGDGKLKFDHEAITEQSSRDNIRPFVVRNHEGDDPSLLWMYNYKYPGFTQFDSAIRVNQKAKGFDSSLNNEAVKTVANAVWDWQVASYKSRVWSGNAARSWVNAVMFNGMDDWATAIDSEDHFKFLTTMFNREHWQVGNMMYHADDICIAQSYLDLYMRYKKPNMMIPTKARMDWVLENKGRENIDITKGGSDRWWWCDALYMAPGAYARMSKITGDKKYMKFAHKEYLATYEHLYDTEENLFYRDARYFTKRSEAGSKIFWARGNGWVIAGIPEILKQLPKDDKKYRPFYEKLLLEMATKMAEIQRPDGYWSSGLLDVKLYPHPETSGTSLNAYAIAYGINEGILPRDKFMPVLEKAWNGMVKAVDTEGKLGWVQTVAASPNRVEKSWTQLYAIGSFLATAAEIYRMEK